MNRRNGTKSTVIIGKQFKNVVKVIKVDCLPFSGYRVHDIYIKPKHIFSSNKTQVFIERVRIKGLNLKENAKQIF